MMEQILLIFCTFDWWLTERGKRKESKLGQQFAFRSARFVTRLEMRKILPAEIRLLFYHFSLFILSVLLVIILKYILTKANSKVLTQLLKANQKIGPWDSKFALSTFNFWIFERKIPTTNVTLYVKSCQYLRCINSCVNFQKKKSLWPPSQFLYSSLHLQFNLTEVLFFLKVILAVCVYQLFFQEWFKEKVLVNMSSSILRRLTQSVQWKTFFFSQKIAGDRWSF